MAALGLPIPPARAATDQLRLALVSQPPHLDPTAGDDPATLAVSYQNIFEGLTLIDEKGAVVPGLAKSWTVSDDGLTYSFALQDQARFHDGTSFDASHVVFSLKRLAAAGAPAYQGIADVMAADALTARVVLKAPDDKFLRNLGLPAAVMVAPESADNNRTVPLGTGPFAFVEWRDGEAIVLERNEDYWGRHPRITVADFIFVHDPATGIAALLDNELDGYPDVPDPRLLDQVRGKAGYLVVTGRGPDGSPRYGAWNAGLTGMWADAPVESCVLAPIRWLSDTSPETTGPAPMPNTDEEP
ncbi:MAG TPA: ABC transporter substrate-binding protein [Devosia sp.]|nr:ABC transporter substrate-binding protein [Devosia sp.]